MAIDHTRAREILARYYPQESSQGSFQVRRNPNTEAGTAEWWTANSGGHATVLDRDKRYLAAYLQMAEVAGNYLWATGLPVDDRFLWYDRAVMATLLAHGCVELRDERFEVTEEGKRAASEVAPRT